MKAELTNKNGHGIFNTKHRKENNFYQQITASTIEKGELIESVILRYYYTGSRNYAAIWIRAAKGAYMLSGTGYASGYGYDRESAAAAEAIQAAGVVLSKNISGAGRNAVEDALIAIAKKATGKRKIFIQSAHA